MAEEQAAEKYDFWERDGAFFRGRAGQQVVTEVWVFQSKAWKPYEGNGAQVIDEGNRIEDPQLEVDPGVSDF